LRTPLPKAGNSYIPTQKRECNGHVREQLLSDTHKHLSGILGEETSEKLIDALGQHLSNNVMRDAVKSKHGKLLKLIGRCKKMLESKVEGIESVISKLKGDASEKPTGEITLTGEFRTRPKHELDDISRSGWTPNQFHALLGRYGFDTSKQGGGGHHFLYYDGEKVRYASGRPILVVHPTTGSEITPGAANDILKGCAAFLVSLEQ
jgi:hypothetical protein